VTQPSGGHVVIPAHDTIHIKGPSPDGERGFNTVDIAREALGQAIAAERFGATYFSNGSQLGGILTTALTGQSLENFRTAVQARHQGVNRAHGWLLAPPDAKFTEVGTSPKDSQLIELREHEVREIARFLRIPVAMIGDLSKATWSNYEQQQLAYYTQCIRPWCANVEQELTTKLVSPFERSQQFIEHVTEGFLRATSKSAPHSTAQCWAAACSRSTKCEVWRICRRCPAARSAGCR
jgi:HK97 family phage portal protein